MTDTDREELKDAKKLLESKTLAEKITELLGVPIEYLMNKIPTSLSSKITAIAEKALRSVYTGALLTMDSSKSVNPSNKVHKSIVTVSGAIGGFFGLLAVAIETPISTAVMARSIADIARSYGEKIDSEEGKLACVFIFALGGEKNKITDYYTIRELLDVILRKIGAYVIGKNLSQEAANLTSRFITNVGTRFAANLSEKWAAQAIPVVGALGGAGVNLMFISHFQQKAKGHFTIRSLERRYGIEEVKKVYNETVI